MATITKTYDASKIFQGPVDVYAAIAAPTSSLTPTADANTLTLDSSGQPTDTGTAGVHLGSVEGPSTISITEKVNEILDDQHENAIDAGFDSIEAEIDFNLKETALAKLLTLLTASTLGARTLLAAQEVLQLGGKLDSAANPITLLLVSPRRDLAGKFLYAMAYKAFLNSALPFSFSRSKENVHKLKFRCVMDLARVAGDELMQIVRTK